MRRALLLALLIGALPLGAGPLRAQSPDLPAREFGRIWGSGALGSLPGLFAPDEIRLHLAGDRHSALPPRMVLPLLEGLRQRYLEGSLDLVRVATADGDPTRGYAEYRWSTRTRAMEEPALLSIVLLFRFDTGAWRITELRISP